MILLDTNVISELMQSPSGLVAQWLHRQDRRSLATTAISQAEILHGIRRLPEGRRRNGLAERFRAFMDLGFGRRVFPFDAAAADAYSSIRVSRSKAGRPIEALDAMIAGIALAQGADVATRNVADFRDCGFEVIDPWV